MNFKSTLAANSEHQKPVRITEVKKLMGILMGCANHTRSNTDKPNYMISLSEMKLGFNGRYAKHENDI